LCSLDNVLRCKISSTSNIITDIYINTIKYLITIDGIHNVLLI